MTNDIRRLIDFLENKDIEITEGLKHLINRIDEKLQKEEKQNELS